MATYKRRPDFVTSEEGIKARKTLDAMVSDSLYVTEPSFIASSEKYADNLIPFVDKHLAYLSSNSSISAEQYLSNLKLMTRIRR